MTEWHAPGAGGWRRDDTHIDAVLTPVVARTMTDAQLAGFEDGFRASGAMLAGFDAYEVGGRVYLRVRIAGAPKLPIWGDKPPAKIKPPGGPPPKFVFKLLFALHPEMRRRARRCKEVFETRAWRSVVTRWHEEVRPRAIEDNLRLQAIDPETLDDRELGGYVVALCKALGDGLRAHFSNVGLMVAAVGDYMARASEWTGASPSEVLALLHGASPASRETAEMNAAIAKALAGAPALRELVTSSRPAAEIVAALRADTGDVGRATNAYLERHGYRSVTGLDVTALTLLELPDVILRGIRAALDDTADPTTRQAAAVEELRARVPAEHRAEHDEALADARACYGVRDDDVGILAVWRNGLVRRGVIAAGRRLAAKGRIDAAEHVFDALPDEIAAMLTQEPPEAASTGAGPTAAELRERAAKRAALDADPPPVLLGEEGEMPPADRFPPAVARMNRAAQAYLDAFHTRERQEPDAGVHGAGVQGVAASGGVYEGRARIVRGPDEFAAIEDGDVLIARYTSPAFNVLLPLIGAIVTDRGGALSHAAIVAREFGLPCVVSTGDGTTTIPDGALVRVDGDRGTVEVLAAKATSTPSRAAAASKAAAPSKAAAARTAAAAETPEAPLANADAVPEAITEGPGRLAPLADAGDPAFGGKATALASALRAGLPVPGGFALDAALVTAVVRGDADAIARVADACRALPAPWAVRSSALGEDSASASFAGQHLTILGVRDEAALFVAIAKVHASATTDAVLAYRKKLGIAGTPRMAVVVQTLLRPEISGVLFSRDPTAAARDGRVVEAIWGLGEALVAGLVTPDRYRVARDGAVLERTIGDKDIAIEPDNDGTAEVAVAPERVRAACLDDARLAELAALASRCEALFGGPQDLEWALAGGRLHLLQSRPVTG
jgi:pyruvate,water dikinase